MRLEQFILNAAIPIGILILGGLFFFVVTFLSALRGTPIDELTTADSLMGLLAAGTISLAFAAVIAAVFASEKNRQDVNPRLQFLLYRMDAKSLQASPQQPVALTPFFSKRSDETNFQLVLQNFGPGTAVDITVSWFVWKLEITDIAKLEYEFQPSPSPPSESGVGAEWLALQVNKEHSWPVSFGYTLTGEEGGSRIPQLRPWKQIVYDVTARDVAGNDKHVVIGWYLSKLSIVGAHKNPWPYLAEWEKLTALQASEAGNPPAKIRKPPP